ncbi:MAG: hypothetical protein NBV67_16185 [Tagaea sp.]|nr:hypothetical protein [Tagaea sp.]
MAGAFGLKRSLAALVLGLGLAAGVSAQHPIFGPTYPAPDPRGAAEHSPQPSATPRQFEFFGDCVCNLFGTAPQGLFRRP